MEWKVFRVPLGRHYLENKDQLINRLVVKMSQGPFNEKEEDSCMTSYTWRLGSFFLQLVTPAQVLAT